MCRAIECHARYEEEQRVAETCSSSDDDAALIAAAPDLARDVLSLADALRAAEARAVAAEASASLPASWLAALAEPHVDFTFAAFGGSVRLASASGPMESLRMMTLSEHGDRLINDPATGLTLPTSARLTPSQARELAAVLTRYANTHEDSR